MNGVITAEISMSKNNRTIILNIEFNFLLRIKSIIQVNAETDNKIKDLGFHLNPYLATSTARFSLIRVTLMFPGYSNSVSILFLISRAKITV